MYFYCGYFSCGKLTTRLTAKFHTQTVRAYKMNLFKTILIFLIISQFSCINNESKLDFEEEVMQELFLELIDSLHYEPNYIPPPPVPLPEIYFETTDQKLKESIYKKDSLERIIFLAKYQKRVEKIKSYSGKKVIAIYDTIYELEENLGILLKEHFQDVEYDGNNQSGYKFNLSQFSINTKYDFKYSSEFPSGNEKWKENHMTHLLNVISLSRIQFDRTKKYGVLEGGIIYGKLSGNGFMIFIKKKSNKWTIDKIIDTWVS